MDILKAFQESAQIGITGHIRPDGDCIGSCLALYQYMKEMFLNDGKTIHLYLDFVPEEFRLLKNWEEVRCGEADSREYDLFVALDCGSIDRLGRFANCFSRSRRTICIDHHISNTAFGMENLVKPDISSTAELLFTLLDPLKISKETAECLYLGIVHDTGVFRHSNTTEQTMAIAGKLIALGASPEKIINQTVYQKTYVQNQILGRCLLESILMLDGKVIVSYITKKMQEFYQIKPEDLSGVINQLMVTKDIEAAVFIREEDSQNYKVSMRSNGIVDVSKIAVYFGGGGHVRAAGCNMVGSIHDVINNITAWIAYQLESAGLYP